MHGGTNAVVYCGISFVGALASGIHPLSGHHSNRNLQRVLAENNIYLIHEFLFVIARDIP
jgi:hypothetical protein